MTVSIAFVLLGLVAAFQLGKSIERSKAKPLPRPQPPPSLVEHVRTLREIVEASGELTPEVEEWLSRVGAIGTDVKALPALADALAEEKDDKPEYFKKGRPDMTPGKGNKEWNNESCLDKELNSAADDDERLRVMTRWLRRFHFHTSWQVWSLEHMKTTKGRDRLRKMFDRQRE